MHRSEPVTKPWAIIGAGPVGSMLAVMLATLFPEQEIHVFDKRHAHIRGHGLDIHADTIRDMINLLSELEVETRRLLASNILQSDARQRAYFENILRRIQSTSDYLRVEISGKFIRTFQISDMLQKLSKDLSPEKVHFHMDTEVKEEDLTACAQPENADFDLSAMSEKHQILHEADWIFGADGSHSGVRKAIFGETSDDLRKDVLTYLLEIKLEMNNKEEVSKFYDKLNRSILPTIKTGRLHIWNQSMDGTATLHIFIDKNVYDALHVKDKDGKFQGEFANPYRRLVNLPDALKHEIEKIIVNIIDAEKIDASTVKVTTIPMHVYKARQLVKMIYNKRFALPGDSGIGLVLARGVNNGFYAATLYASAMYRDALKRSFSPGELADFAVYQRFWEDQHQKLENLTSWLDVNISMPDNDVRQLAYRQISILDEYEKFYQRVLALPATLSKDQHAAAVRDLANEFHKFILGKIHLPTEKTDREIRNFVMTLFAGLMDKDYLAAHKITEFHRCQDRLIARANEKIADAKFEVKLINTMAKVYDTSSSIISSSKMDDDEPALDEPIARPAKEALLKLLQTIKGFNLEQHPEQAHFVFRVDRMYLELERHANRWSNVATSSRRNKLIKFIDNTREYLTALPQIGTRASIEFAQQAPTFLGKTLAEDITRSGNYVFNEIRSLQAHDASYFIGQARKSLEALIDIENHRSGLWYYVFGDDTDKERELKYQLLLNKNEINEHRETLGLITLYALFSNANAVHLRYSMLKSMLGPALAAGKTVTEQDVLVMREVLLKKITDKLQTQQTSVIKKYAVRIFQAIDRPQADDPVTHYQALEQMLAQLTLLRQTDPASLIERAVKGLAVYKQNKQDGVYDSFSSTSLSSISSSKELDSSYESFGKVSRLFKAAPVAKPVYELILENKADASDSSLLIRLSIVYALLTSRKNENLTREITNCLSPGGFLNKLDTVQIAEYIESILKAHIPKDKLDDFPAVMHKLVSGINSGSKLEKELLRLTDMYKQTVQVESKKACEFTV